MAEFEDFPIQTDPDALLADFIAELRTYWPNFEPNESSLLYRGAASLARMIAEGRDVAAMVPGEVFRTAGTSLFSVPPESGQAARADTEWTMRDAAGYSVPEGALLSINGVLFETADDLDVQPGDTVAPQVPIVALEVGEAASNLGGPGVLITLEEGLEFVMTVTLLSATSGGADAETMDEYMNRLRTALQLLSIIPILPPDLANVAKSLTGIERAAIIDNYDAATDTPNVAGHATVVPIDALGGPVPSLTKDQLATILTAGNRRLLNAVIHVIDPTYTDVDITVEGIAYPDAVPADVEAAVAGAVAQFLDPSLWGQPPTGEDREWINKPVVSIYDVAAAIDQAEGFDRATLITIGLAAGAQTAADHNLPGVAPLPNEGIIDVTVVAP